MASQEILNELIAYREELGQMESSYRQFGSYLSLPQEYERRAKTIVREARDLIRDHFPEAAQSATALWQAYANGCLNEFQFLSLRGFQDVCSVLDALIVRTKRNFQLSKSAASEGISAAKLTTAPRVFISHSSADAPIAEAFVELLRVALHLRSEDIRCTSLHGYKLSAGDDFDQRLRQEVISASEFVPLVSFNSIESMYVLFEMGARWGQTLRMSPILVSNVRPVDLKRPLSDLHAAEGSSITDVSDLIDDIAKRLGLDVEKRSAFQKLLTNFCELAAKHSLMEVPSITTLVGESDELSIAAGELLRAAGNSQSGQIIRMGSFDGVAIEAGGQNFTTGKPHRYIAMYDAALDELQSRDFVSCVVQQHIAIYQVTEKGYRFLESRN